MHWPLTSPPVSPAEIPFYNLHYLHACDTPSDPTILWGTQIDAEALESYVRERNGSGGPLISAAHVLVQAVGRALEEHPRLNSRVVGHRIYRYRDVNVRIMVYDKRRNETDVLLIPGADRMPLADIARIVWGSQCQSAGGALPMDRDKQRIRRLPGALFRWILRAYLWLDRNFRLPGVGRIDRLSHAPVLVNYLSFPDAPPMRLYKPSKYPDESSHLSLTMGRIEEMPVVHEGEICVRRTAPLFVRADHRLADPYLLARFLSTLCKHLSHPEALEPQQPVVAKEGACAAA